MDSDAIYINRGGHGFEKYAGTRETLAIVGWPSLFPERFRSNEPVSVAPAIRFLHTDDETGLHMVSMNTPDDAMWKALERHVERERQGS